MGLVPAGSHANRRFCENHLVIEPRVDPITTDILSDAQTSGGLFIAIASEDGKTLMTRLKEAGVTEAAVIGEVSGTGVGRIRVLP